MAVDQRFYGEQRLLLKVTKEPIIEKTYSAKISPPLRGRGCPYNYGLISNKRRRINDQLV
jgi:hypothetical protein